MIAVTLLFLDIFFISFILMCNHPLTTVTYTFLLLNDIARWFYYPLISLNLDIATRLFNLCCRNIMKFNIRTTSLRKLWERMCKTSLGAYFTITIVAKVTIAHLRVMLLLWWSFFGFLLGFWVDTTWYIRTSVFAWVCSDCLRFWWFGILFLFLVALAKLCGGSFLWNNLAAHILYFLLGKELTGLI